MKNKNDITLDNEFEFISNGELRLNYVFVGFSLVEAKLESLDELVFNPTRGQSF